MEWQEVPVAANAILPAPARQVGTVARAAKEPGVRVDPVDPVGTESTLNREFAPQAAVERVAKGETAGMEPAAMAATRAAEERAVPVDRPVREGEAVLR